MIFISMCIPDKVINQPTDAGGEIQTTVTKEDENIELNGGPVTEQVMEPNITINEPGEPEDDELEDDESEEPAEDETSDADWDINRVIRDLAYFLRAHKFQDYDRRYFKSIDEAPTHLHEEFPRPSLRSLHWEAHKNCDLGFTKCLQYADQIVRMTSLQRKHDTLTLMRENKWELKKNTLQILAAQRECHMAKRRDNLTAVPFQGPIGKIISRNSLNYILILGSLELPFISLSLVE